MVPCKNKTIEGIDTEPVMTGYASTYNNDYSTDHSQGNVATLAKMGETKKPVVKTVVVYRDAPSGSNSTASSGTSTKKKGWSNAAKGTVIGAGSGAILGAVVSKNKAAGAVLGGLIGAGAGYAVGNEIDKKKKRNQ